MATKEYKLNIPFISEEDYAKQAKGQSIEAHVKLEDGQGFKGKFVGWDVRFLNDKNAPEGKKLVGVIAVDVTTKDGGKITARITATHELEAQVDGIPPGTEITIFRLGQVDIGNGRKVTRYSVASPEGARVKEYYKGNPLKKAAVDRALAAPAPALGAAEDGD